MYRYISSASKSLFCFTLHKACVCVWGGGGGGVCVCLGGGGGVCVCVCSVRKEVTTQLFEEVYYSLRHLWDSILESLPFCFVFHTRESQNE